MQQHLLWQAEANEFIQHYPPQRRRPPPKTMLMQQRRSTGLMYTHPPTTALMTLNKRASTGGSGNGNSYSNGNGNGNGNGVDMGGMGVISGGKLLSAQQRHQRDLFTGELGTHVGNVIHTFETLALQRRLAEHSQYKKQQQQQQQKQSKQQTYGKYLVGGLKFNKQQLKHRQQTQKHQYQYQLNNSNNKNQYTNYNTLYNINRNTLNERNKQISAQYLAMESDYRKNFMKDDNDCTKIVNAAFDDMLASYSDDIDEPQQQQQQPINTTSTIEINNIDNNNDFIRGSTISQSFVRPTTNKIKKQAPLPPIPPPPPPPPLPLPLPLPPLIQTPPTLSSPSPSPTPTTTFKNLRAHNNNKAQCRLTLVNPFRHVFLLPSKRSKSFNLI